MAAKRSRVQKTTAARRTRRRTAYEDYEDKAALLEVILESDTDEPKIVKPGLTDEEIEEDFLTFGLVVEKTPGRSAGKKKATVTLSSRRSFLVPVELSTQCLVPSSSKATRPESHPDLNSGSIGQHKLTNDRDDLNMPSHKERPVFSAIACKMHQRSLQDGKNNTASSTGEQDADAMNLDDVFQATPSLATTPTPVSTSEQEIDHPSALEVDPDHGFELSAEDAEFLNASSIDSGPPMSHDHAASQNNGSALEPKQPFQLNQPHPLGIQVPVDAAGTGFEWIDYDRAIIDWASKDDVLRLNEWRNRATRARAKKLKIYNDRRKKGN